MRVVAREFKIQIHSLAKDTSNSIPLARLLLLPTALALLVVNDASTHKEVDLTLETDPFAADLHHSHPPVPLLVPVPPELLPDLAPIKHVAIVCLDPMSKLEMVSGNSTLFA